MVKSSDVSARPRCAPLSIVIRADASSDIGTGHVLRNLGLAHELRLRGHSVAFICSAVPGNLVDLIRARDFQCGVLSAGLDAVGDARATAELLAGFEMPVHWLIVDHYGLDARWEEMVRPCAQRLFAIDELANRPHNVDVLLDQVHNERQLYEGLVSSNTQLLLGPSFVLLRREFFSRPQLPRQVTFVRRLLITFGGNDPLDMTSRAIEALDHSMLAQLCVDVTLGVSNPRVEEVKRLAILFPNVAIHVQHPEPSQLMERADLCLGAGGTTTWERCYLGLPSLIIVLADNQRDFAERCGRLGVARVIGRGEELAVTDLQAALVRAMDDGDWRQTSSIAGQSLVDGKGIDRVIAVLEERG